ncbi:MAG: hypothetical protein ACLFN5_04050 [bacterium]
MTLLFSAMFIAGSDFICYSDFTMAKRKFKILPEKRVGKTQLIYKGPQRDLEKLREAFKTKKSSEVYPSLKAGYESALFFYHTDEKFLRHLYRYCKENLSALAQKKRGLDTARLMVRTVMLGAIALAAYFVYGLIIFILEALRVVG